MPAHHPEGGKGTDLQETEGARLIECHEVAADLAANDLARGPAGRSGALRRLCNAGMVGAAILGDARLIAGALLVDDDGRLRSTLGRFRHVSASGLKADRRARDPAGVVAPIQAAGASSFKAVADELNRQGITTARGGRWQTSPTGTFREDGL
jgi:hypothetical protein